MQTRYPAWPAIGRPAASWARALVADETASVHLVRACQRLDDLRLAALFGGTYDPEEYDQAILAYRSARAMAAHSAAVLATRLRHEDSSPAA